MSIVSVRSNPELTEVPEDYEPRHWEYYRHPLTRFTARYIFNPAELENEMFLNLFEDQSENMMLKHVRNKAEKVMRFYNDHRSSYFKPYYAELIRSGRDQKDFAGNAIISSENIYYDAAYNPDINPLPTEGYVPTSVD